MQTAIIKAKAGESLSNEDVNFVVNALGRDKYTHTVIHQCQSRSETRVGFARYLDNDKNPHVYEWRNDEPVTERDFSDDNTDSIKDAIREYASSYGLDRLKKILNINSAIRTLDA